MFSNNRSIFNRSSEPALLICQCVLQRRWRLVHNLPPLIGTIPLETFALKFFIHKTENRRGQKKHSITPAICIWNSRKDNKKKCSTAGALENQNCIRLFKNILSNGPQYIMMICNLHKYEFLQFSFACNTNFTLFINFLFSCISNAYCFWFQ